MLQVHWHFQVRILPLISLLRTSCTSTYAANLPSVDKVLSDTRYSRYYDDTIKQCVS
ncbi:hypothetical protein BD777DRAFT_130943 [Yarrowia lipolytica]|nr:hypothetical protein BD777DRAFT_130943 [Yarrowia lipolytica]